MVIWVIIVIKTPLATDSPKTAPKRPKVVPRWPDGGVQLDMEIRGMQPYNTTIQLEMTIRDV